jgi:hypothetical protein
MKKLIITLALAVGIAIGASACTTNDADVVSKNLSKDADNFKIERQIVFYNGITGEYVAEVTGKCSVEAGSVKLAVVCKTGKDEYIKNYLGLSDNVTWFALQSGPAKVSDDHYKVVFKPSTVIPDFEVR